MHSEKDPRTSLEKRVYIYTQGFFLFHTCVNKGAHKNMRQRLPVEIPPNYTFPYQNCIQWYNIALLLEKERRPIPSLSPMKAKKKNNWQKQQQRRGKNRKHLPKRKDLSWHTQRGRAKRKEDGKSHPTKSPNIKLMMARKWKSFRPNPSHHWDQIT